MTAQVNGHGAIEHGEVNVQRIAIFHDDAQVGGIDMRPVQPAKTLDRSLDGLLHRSLIGNIDMDGKGFATRFRSDLRRAIDIDVGGADPRAFLGQALDRGRTDTRGATEYDDAAASQSIAVHEILLTKAGCPAKHSHRIIMPCPRHG